eukprot:m.18351 g.18351  ORF g.18351 m.18351 type:complete len:221 (-) comp7809_c0_seq1:728-1390(-)
MSDNLEWRRVEEGEEKQYYDDLRTQNEEECARTKKPFDCHMLAEFYQVVDREYTKAADMFRTLCDEQKYGRSCFAYGTCALQGQGAPRERSLALEYFERGCQYGSIESCHNAGMVLWSKNSDGVPQDVEKALPYFEKGCKDDFRNSCFMLSSIFLSGRGSVAKDPAKALDYAIRSCELRHTWGCINAALMLQKGDGVPKDEAKAKELRARASELSQSDPA